VLEDACLAVLGEDRIFGAQRGCRAHCNALLARADHVEADATLPLRVEHDDVHDGHCHHVFVQSDRLFVRDVGALGVFVDYDAILVEHTVGGHGIVFGCAVEGELGGEFTVDCSGEVDAVLLSVFEDLDEALFAHTGLNQAAARPWTAIFAGIGRIRCCLGGLSGAPLDAMVRVIVWTPFWLSGGLQRSHS
jgi:hypothetical protein